MCEAGGESEGAVVALIRMRVAHVLVNVATQKNLNLF